MITATAGLPAEIPPVRCAQSSLQDRITYCTSQTGGLLCEAVEVRDSATGMSIRVDRLTGAIEASGGMDRALLEGNGARGEETIESMPHGSLDEIEERRKFIAEEWEAASSLDGDHPVLVRLGLSAEGRSAVRASLRISRSTGSGDCSAGASPEVELVGQRIDGAGMVCGLSFFAWANDQLTEVQRIDLKGYEHGASVRLGAPIPDGRVALAVGLATGLAARELTGLPTLIVSSPYDLAHLKLPRSTQSVVALLDAQAADIVAVAQLQERLRSASVGVSALIVSSAQITWVDVLRAKDDGAGRDHSVRGIALAKDRIRASKAHAVSLLHHTIARAMQRPSRDLEHAISGLMVPGHLITLACAKGPWRQALSTEIVRAVKAAEQMTSGASTSRGKVVISTDASSSHGYRPEEFGVQGQARESTVILVAQTKIHGIECPSTAVTVRDRVEAAIQLGHVRCVIVDIADQAFAKGGAAARADYADAYATVALAQAHGITVVQFASPDARAPAYEPLRGAPALKSWIPAAQSVLAVIETHPTSKVTDALLVVTQGTPEAVRTAYVMGLNDGSDGSCPSVKWLRAVRGRASALAKQWRKAPKPSQLSHRPEVLDEEDSTVVPSACEAVKNFEASMERRQADHVGPASTDDAQEAPTRAASYAHGSPEHWRAYSRDFWDIDDLISDRPHDEERGLGLLPVGLRHTNAESESTVRALEAPVSSDLSDGAHRTHRTHGADGLDSPHGHELMTPALACEQESMGKHDSKWLSASVLLARQAAQAWGLPRRRVSASPKAHGLGEQGEDCGRDGGVSNCGVKTFATGG